MSSTRLTIFIGSARESQKITEWIAAFLVECGHEVLPWYDARAFPAGEITLPRLIELSRLVDAAIFIFSEDDRVVVRDIQATQPRDNVLLEYGLFVAALGRQRSIICAVGRSKIPVDVAGITYIDATNEYAARPRLREWLNSLEQGTFASAEEYRGHIEIQHFKSSEHEDFTERIRQRLPAASRIVMMGSGLALLGRPTVIEQLMQRAKQGKATVEIYMANPFSPAVETRLIEEEEGTIRPPDGKRGLLDRLSTLVRYWDQMGRPESVSIRTFSHYPTFALMIIDDEYYVYPYAYKLLGNFSPVFAFSRRLAAHRDLISFLDAHYLRLKQDATAADVLFDRTGQGSGKLYPFAVFFVPRIDSELYELGTRIIGYDVRRKKVEAVEPFSCVGAANLFGFHLTVCDALYFSSEADRRHAVAEVEYLLNDVTPFEIRGIRLERDYPTERNVALAVESVPDMLEAIHHEFVHRIYRRAAASDYTLGRAELAAAQRTNSEILLHKYHAPYILNRFRPHFTLLSNCGSDQWEVNGSGLTAALSRLPAGLSLTVDQLAIMSCSRPGERWFIEKEIGFGRR